MLTRRALLASAAACGVARAEDRPVRIGFLTTLTGPVAAGGIQMQQGLNTYLKQHGNTLGGRPVQVFTADTNSSPATTRTKTQEFVEQNGVDVLIGPLAANEALAIGDYVAEKRIPLIVTASAEDMTQRKANPWFARVTSSSAQCSYPMADYALHELGYKRMATLGEDNAYGWEQTAGFQRVFEDGGGRIVQKLFPPLSAIDYATYIAQIKPDIDAIYVALAGSNGFRFFRQCLEYGFGDKVKILGGMTMVDEANLPQMGPQAAGLISACWYSAQIGTPTNRAFVAAMQQEYKATPGFYAAATATAAAVLDHALTAVGGNTDDRDALMKAIRTQDVPDTVRGPMHFDAYGNVVGNVYIRRVDKKDGALVNTIIKTYPDVSQFWHWGAPAFLANPVYARDEPKARYLE